MAVVPPLMATYQGYFMNGPDKYSFFSFNYTTNQGVLTRYENSTCENYPVVGGIPSGIRLNPREQLWLRACWSTANGNNQPEANKALLNPNAEQSEALQFKERSQNIFGGRMRAWRKAREQHKDQ